KERQPLNKQPYKAHEVINITTICLIRHGETDWNAQRRIQGRTDIPLNEKGIQQARECRDFLKNSEWDVIITSPLKRAKQTAEIINEALNIDLIEMDDFIEKSFGDVEGVTLQRSEEHTSELQSREKLVCR